MVTMVQVPVSEHQTLLERLKSADSVKALAEAPAGSHLAALRDAVPEAWSTAEALRERRQRVYAERSRAEQALSGADETADFAALAEDLVRVDVLGRVARNLDAEVLRAEQVARAAERAADDAWLRVVAAREQLRDMLDRHEEDPTRIRRYLRELRDLLDVPIESAG